ncbi:hypothetical protein Tco_0868170 [Tanacetum coccineum]
METQAIDDQDHLVNYDNDNENDDFGYRSEEYFDEAHEEDENNHSNGNVVKRGITRLYKFRREYGKPDGIKLSVTFDVLNRISGKHRALFSSFLGDMVREHIGLKILSWKNVDSGARDKLWDEITIEKKEIEPDEEPPRGTLWLKGRVNKDGEYLDDEIRSVGDKLGACVFTDKWSLDELAYDVPRDGPYQTNPPSPDDIISYIRYDREERNTRKDCGTRRGCHSSSSSSAFDQPSSSYLNDDDDDGNDERTSRASTPSPTYFVNSLTNEVPQVFQNPPNIDPDMKPFYTR